MPDNIKNNISISLNGLNERQQEIQRYQDCYHGRFFTPEKKHAHSAEWEWGEKWDPAGNPVPKSQWRPLYKAALGKKIVHAHTDKLFTEDAFPGISITSYSCDIYKNIQLPPDYDDPERAKKVEANKKLQVFLDALIRKSRLQQFMDEKSPEVITQGKCAVIVGVFAGKFHFECIDRKWFDVEYSPEEPTVIDSFTEMYVIQEEDPLTKKTTDYVYKRFIDHLEDKEYKRILKKDERFPQVSEKDLISSTQHNLGFCPVVIIQRTGGQSIFADEIVGNIEGFIRYDNDIKASIRRSLDPQRYTLAPDSGPDLSAEDLSGESSSQVLESGTVWPLKAKGAGEFGTQGSKTEALDDKRSTLKEILESVGVVEIEGGNEQSGYALFLRLSPMKSAVNKHRSSLGEGLASMLLMMIKIVQQLTHLKQSVLLPPGVEIPADLPGNELEIAFDWGDIDPPDEEDKGKGVFNAATAKNEGLISQKTATRYVSSFFGVSDIEAEIAQIAQERAEGEDQFIQQNYGRSHGQNKY